MTAQPRPWISPRLIPAPDGGYAPDHPSARRFWIALLGPAAVADLLRLVAAARTGRRIRRPLHLGLLVSEGLVVRERDSVLVPAAIPPLSPGHRRRLRPALRAEYRRVAGA